MKTRRFDFNFRPLQIDISILVDSSVPEKQNYDADTDEYTPDYTLAPLAILPAVSILDKDEVLSAGRINQHLANIKWYEIIGGVSTLITSTNTNYEITTTGGQAGRILVKKNAQPNNPITLEFYAEYVDSRTSQLHVIRGSKMITCNNSTVCMPQLLLDAADQTIYNPLNDAATQTVHASLRLGTNECPAANRAFVWEKFREDNTWTTVGTDTVQDYDVTVSSDGTSCTVNRSLMGAELYLRCRAKYDANGNPAGVTLTDASPCKVIAFVRRLPKFEYDFTGVPVNIPAGLLYIYPVAVIMDANGVIDNTEAEKELLSLWYFATNKASGTLSYSLAAHGATPTIPTTLMSASYGGVLGIEAKDRGYIGAWEDSDGAVFEDGDGNLLLIQ